MPFLSSCRWCVEKQRSIGVAFFSPDRRPRADAARPASGTPSRKDDSILPCTTPASRSDECAPSATRGPSRPSTDCGCRCGCPRSLPSPNRATRLNCGRLLVVGVFASRHSVLIRPDLVVDGIEPRNEVRARFRRSVDQAVRVERRIAAVGRDLVMQIAGRRVPVPLRHDEVALHAGRTRRLRERQFALRDRDPSNRRNWSARERCRNCRCRCTISWLA